MPVDLATLVIAWIVTFGTAAVQGLVGMGFAAVSVPVLSLVNPILAPVPQLLVTMPLTLTMAWRERHAMDLAGVGWIIAGRLPGAALGLILLKIATDRTLDVLIAIAVLAAVTVIGTGIKVKMNPITKFGAGVFSGTSALVASIGGPPLALLYRDHRGETIRSSLAAVFSIGVAITVLTRIAAREITVADVQIAVLIFPALIAGYVASWRLRGRFEGTPIRMAIVVLSSLAAGGLLIRALVG